MIGIIGGGFGLYGYLPAVAERYPDEIIMLQTRAKSKFESRPELQKYKDRIQWVDNPKIPVWACRLLILAIPPKEIQYYLSAIYHSTTLETVILEKPIGIDPETAEFYVSQIEKSGKKVVSSFIFPYNNWAFELTDWICDSNETNILLINWMFKADHFKNNKDTWKKDSKLGGGVLKFYGIHLLSLLSLLKYEIDEVYISNDIEFSAIFKSKNSPQIMVNIYCNALSNFFLLRNKQQNETIYLEGPFDEWKYESPFYSADNKNDKRCYHLYKLLRGIEVEYGTINENLHNTIRLWKQVEEKQKSN